MKLLVLIINSFLISLISPFYYSQTLEKKFVSLIEDLNETEKISFKRSSRSTSSRRSTSSSPSTIDRFSPFNITKQKDINYIAYIKLSKNKIFSVIFDTGLPMSWFPSVDCITCKPNTSRYNFSSSWYAKNKEEKKNLSKPYLPGLIEGNIIFDTISLDFQGKRIIRNYSKSYKYEVNLNYYKFISVTKEELFEERVSDGVIGLGFNIKDYYSSLIRMMINNDYINYKCFSFYLLDNLNISKIYFGDITNNYYIYNLFHNNISECKVKENALYWECNTNIIKLLNNKTYNNENIFETNVSIIFDSGFLI